MRKDKKKKREEFKKRYDAVKNMMSTFAMGTVAVVAVVTLIPASPKAEIIKAVSTTEEVVYQVNVTDEEEALDLDTLFVVLENQLEYYEQPVSLGENSGYFNELSTNTEYRLSVYGNKGFGQERLDTQMVKTRDKPGGTILSVDRLDDDSHFTEYIVNLSIHDPDGKYSSYQLYYGYETEPDEPINYSQLPLTLSTKEVILDDIHTSGQFHVYITGTINGEEEILDGIWVTPPFQLYSSVYLGFYTNNRVRFHIYGDYTVDNIRYIMKTYKDDKLIKTEEVDIKENTHGDSNHTVSGLQPDTMYRFECTAIYKNPQTLRDEELIILDQMVMTLKDYSVSYELEEFDEHYEITVTLDDPEGYFNNIYYEIYSVNEGMEVYEEGHFFYFEEIDGEIKAITSITKPDFENYIIYVVMSNNTDTYIRDVITTIESN